MPKLRPASRIADDMPRPETSERKANDMQCIVVNVTDRDEWTDQAEHPRRKLAVGLHIPAKHRPALVYHTRAEAEAEAARLACTSENGWTDTYAVFELVAVVKGKVPAETDRVQGMGACNAMVPKWDDEPGVAV